MTYIPLQRLQEQQLDILEQIRDNTKNIETHLALGSDEELEGEE